MKRTIEELIAKRKAQQLRLKQTLDEIAGLVAHKGLLKKKNLAAKIGRLDDDLNALITAQDREWDAYVNNHATVVFKSLEWKIEKLEAEYSQVKTLLANFVNLERAIDRLIGRIDAAAPAPAASRHELSAAKEKLSVFQYADFERRFRGDETAVREKLQRYVPHFTGSGPILEIGCGRGEFLELLRQEGKSALGIDRSDSMLEHARAKGLDCHREDALAFLKTQPDASFAGIFSSQVIEHFPPDYLTKVVSESFRVLRPGAVIVLETINPLSLFAWSRIFLLDVTHQKPLHPEYMRYLTETAGFTRVEILFGEAPAGERLEEVSSAQESARALNANVDRLNDLLFAPVEYAVKGFKP